MKGLSPESVEYRRDREPNLFPMLADYILDILILRNKK